MHKNESESLFCSPSFMDEERAKEQAQNLIAIGVGIFAGIVVAAVIFGINS